MALVGGGAGAPEPPTAVLGPGMTTVGVGGGAAGEALAGLEPPTVEALDLQKWKGMSLFLLVLKVIDDERIRTGKTP